ncbi:hypothetical protein FHS95_000734 [Sphingomonas naasensis]|uniref:Uncharacterized protein n=1 Tax=Sphingomonas naasensis TaxID=1344951 RepID=A0A4S1WT57_9SPHN|nr:hypothetical protein [Sphingomonas naasensis]NIJ19065.1 hypothetical protein [Sphingomonas naasensis]TGX46263.1 hypothetical protein E5A74_03660 [Sphingomonas naasensis]
MKLRIALLPMLLSAVPLSVAAAQDIKAGITSTKTASAVSVSADPALSDGRLVLRVAAQNRTRAPVPFGPASVTIATAAGEAIAIRPLAALVADVEASVGLEPSGSVSGYAENPTLVNNTAGQKDVTGFTGGMNSGVARGSGRRKPKAADVAAANAQIAALKAGILADASIGAGQVAAGQLVSEKIRFRDKRKRGLVVTVTVAGETHSFAFDAPE